MCSIIRAFSLDQKTPWNVDEPGCNLDGIDPMEVKKLDEMKRAALTSAHWSKRIRRVGWQIFSVSSNLNDHQEPFTPCTYYYG